MMGLAEIVRANDDATNARTYRATLANVYDKLGRVLCETDAHSIARELVLDARDDIRNAMEQTNVC